MNFSARGVIVKRLAVASLALFFALLGAHAQAAGADRGAPLGERSLFSERAISERLRSPGRVCLEGDEDCGEERLAVAEEEEDTGPRPGPQIYSQACAACHDTGAAGAPRTGDLDDWSDRFDKGLDQMVQSTVDGLGAMPPMGGCGDCDEDDLKRAIEHIMEQTQ